MLVLSRKAGETLMIGDSISITVLRCDRSGKVRLGIDAPKEMNVVRGELLDQEPPAQAVVKAS